MMIRSCNIPPILNRICDDTIHSAFLVTRDGALLGASNNKSQDDPEAIAALLADVGVDYQRLGEEYAAVDANPRSKSHLRCLLVELEQGLVGIAGCSDIDSLVIVVGEPNAPPGLVKAKVEALADYVQESLVQSN